MTKNNKLCKIVKKILQNKKNVRFNDIDKLLKEFNYTVNQSNAGTSHYVYRKKEHNPITIPYKRPFIKECYIKEIIDILNLEELYEKNC
jgi:hypothetical protein